MVLILRIWMIFFSGVYIVFVVFVEFMVWVVFVCWMCFRIM